MAEYIERDEAVRKAIDACIKVVGHGITQFDAVDIAEAIESIPTADVVEVVRCKSCEYCCISTDPKTNISIQKCGYVGFNPVQSSQVSDDFYCGYGELKEREG